MTFKFVLGFMLALISVSSAEEKRVEPTIVGSFQVISIRNASDVAAVRRPEDLGGEAIGQMMTFTREGLMMDDMSCDQWQVFMSLVPVINAEDPILGDIHIAPTDSPLSAGDKRIGKTFHYRCEGESFIHVYQVDERVLVIPWQNSSQYLIVEKSLSEEQISKLQSTLKDHKFLEQDANGKMDEATINAVSAWSHYRLADDEAYKFKRAAITENLLDSFQILEE